MRLSQKIIRNLTIQGFDCNTINFEKIEPWLRFNPAICLAVVSISLIFSSPVIFFTLVAVNSIRAFSRHAAGDIIYNYIIRRFTETPPLPPNPAPRRFACFIGMAWSAAIGLLFVFNYFFTAFILGIIFIIVVIPMVFFHFCVASEIYQKIIGRYR